jgi:hypothetical protein
MDWFDPAQDKSQCEHDNEPLGSRKFCERLLASQEELGSMELV